MIRKNIETGTEVFHNGYGFGEIVENFGNNSFKVSFYKNEPKILIIHRGKLTEIEPDLNKTFNPPI